MPNLEVLMLWQKLKRMASQKVRPPAPGLVSFVIFDKDRLDAFYICRNR
jgi:hypothetical protein